MFFGGCFAFAAQTDRHRVLCVRRNGGSGLARRQDRVPLRSPVREVIKRETDRLSDRLGKVLCGGGKAERLEMENGRC